MDGNGSHTHNHVKNATLLVSTVVVVIAVAAAVYFYLQYYQAQMLLKNPTLAATEQTQQLVAQVGKLIQLPTNETPTIATVSDVSKLKEQPFFANAHNGDKVLIYTNAREAILFRPSEDKIINVAPVNLGQNVSVTPAATASPTLAPTVVPTKSAAFVTPTPIQSGPTVTPVK